MENVCTSSNWSSKRTPPEPWTKNALKYSKQITYSQRSRTKWISSNTSSLFSRRETLAKRNRSSQRAILSLRWANMWGLLTSARSRTPLPSSPEPASLRCTSKPVSIDALVVWWDSTPFWKKRRRKPSKVGIKSTSTRKRHGLPSCLARESSISFWPRSKVYSFSSTHRIPMW